MQYRSIIKQILQNHVYTPVKAYDEYESQVVTDDEKGHFYLMKVGWDNMKRIHGCTIHMDLKGEKIWIQEDWTEYGVANELLDAGVPKEDIVLAFHAPYKRPYTGFAAA